MEQTRLCTCANICFRRRVNWNSVEERCSALWNDKIVPVHIGQIADFFVTERLARLFNYQIAVNVFFCPDGITYLRNAVHTLVWFRVRRRICGVRDGGFESKYG